MEGRAEAHFCRKRLRGCLHALSASVGQARQTEQEASLFQQRLQDKAAVKALRVWRAEAEAKKDLRQKQAHLERSHQQGLLKAIIQEWGWLAAEEKAERESQEVRVCSTVRQIHISTCRGCTMASLSCVQLDDSAATVGATFRLFDGRRLIFAEHACLYFKDEVFCRESADDGPAISLPTLTFGALYNDT